MTNNYLVIDLETNTLEKYGRKANPWYNDIVAIGLKQKDFREEASIDAVNYLGWKFVNYPINLLVGHNIKFDLLYLWPTEYLQIWLRQGGKIWDTQLAEYYLTSFQSKYAALRDIAVIKYGCKEREKKMEVYWADNVKVLNWTTKEIIKIFPKGTNNIEICQWIDTVKVSSLDIIHGPIDTKDIPKEIVLSDVKQDVLDTEQVYLKQIDIANKLGIIELLEIQMDYLLSTIEMEFNGFKIDTNLLEKNKLDLEKELNLSELELRELIKEYWK